MKIGDIIRHVLGDDHPAVRNANAATGDEVPVLVTGVDEDGNATGTAFHPDGSTSVIRIDAPDKPEAQPVPPAPTPATPEAQPAPPAPTPETPATPEAQSTPPAPNGE